MKKFLFVFWNIVVLAFFSGCGVSEKSKQLQGRLINACVFMKGDPKFCGCMANKIVSSMSSKEISDYLQNTDTVYARQAQNKTRWDNEKWLNACRYEIFGKK